ncbi:MAG: hypothetical protein RL167_603 [Actinomycetota bacterium]|jgi:PhzF family phenazine biosynthesis protein
MARKMRTFAQVDVFSKTPYLGNPVAVVLDAEGMTEESMAEFARWTNLSETTFVLPPTDPRADYRLRIFTPGGELPFAGHPTLGSGHAWLESGGVPKTEGTLVQECGAGLVSLKVRDQASGAKLLSFKAPKTVHSGPLEQEVLDEIIGALGVEPSEVVAHQWVDNGPGWACVQLASASRVLELNPKFTDGSNLMVGLVGAYSAGSEAAFELRAFAPKIGVYEDPVTGSLNASVAQWLFASGVASGAYTASQGARLGRKGVIGLSIDADGDVWVGGPTITCIQGRVDV